MIVRAAKYWGAKPWEMLEVPTFWTEMATRLMTEEATAQEKINKRRAKRRGTHSR